MHVNRTQHDNEMTAVDVNEREHGTPKTMGGPISEHEVACDDMQTQAEKAQAAETKEEASATAQGRD